MDDFEETLEPTNEIIEITDEEEVMYDTAPVEEVKENKKNKKKEKKPNKWSKLSKKQKIIICSVIGGILLVLIIGLLLYFLVFKKDNKKIEEKHEPEVILEKENYRYEDGILIFLNDKKEEIGKYECQNKNEEKCYLASYSGEDDFDVAKRVYSNNKGIEELSDIFENKYVFINDNATNVNKEIILYDLKEQKELGKYLLIKLIDDETLIAQDTDEKYGTLSTKDMSKKIDFKYDYLGLISEHDDLVAKDSSGSLIITKDGEKISKAMKGDIKNYDENYISISNNGVYNLYDYNAQKVLDKNVGFITFKNGYVFLIDTKKLFAYDDELNALNYEGIRLSSSNYVKKIVFNDELKEVEREDTFDINVGTNTIQITDGDNTIEINLNEGKLNKNLKYISYYDGTLYIFTDEEKTNLVGSYICGNKNEITKNTTTLDNCTIASETVLLNRNSNSSDKVGLLPVFNNRYVFINDTKNPSESNIILYDLKNKSNKATYQAVDAGYYKEGTDLGFELTADRVVMARNTSGNYGLIRFLATGVEGFIAFQEKAGNDKPEGILGNTKVIKYLGNNILVQREENRYVLYDETGKSWLGYASNEIVDYNENNKALKLKNNDIYAITNNVGGKIYKSNLIYVDMLKDYFVGIDKDLKLNVYKYVENAKGLIENDVVVKESSNYANSYSIVDGGKSIEVEGKIYSLVKTEPVEPGPVVDPEKDDKNSDIEENDKTENTENKEIE